MCPDYPNLSPSVRKTISALMVLFLIGCYSGKSNVFVCSGDVEEFYSFDEEKNGPFFTKEKLVIIFDGDHVKFEGTSAFYPIFNYAYRSESQKLNSASLCKSEALTDLYFNSYACDFEKNVTMPDALVTEGAFNVALNELNLHQHRKYKFSMKKTDFSYKTGKYTCTKKHQ